MNAMKYEICKGVPDGDDIIFPTEAEAIEFIREYENNT